MQRAKIMQLFQLFSGAEVPELWADLVDSAIAQTAADCKENADRTDIRLCYYAAALANLYYRQLLAARGAVSPTYAGRTAAIRDDTQPCALAERLVRAYRDAASTLLKDRQFIFQCTSYCAEEHEC